jgi:hypothetical protein
MPDIEEGQIAITFMSGPYDGKTEVWEVPEGASETVLTIGRREGCDIMLDYDSQVSRIHARLVHDEASGAYYLEDMNSRNGTFIGQDRIRGRVLLPPGDLFRIGRTWMRVERPGSIAAEDDDLPF